MLGGVAVVVVLRLLVHDEVLAPLEVLHAVALLVLAVEGVLILRNKKTTLQIRFLNSLRVTWKWHIHISIVVCNSWYAKTVAGDC